MPDPSLETPGPIPTNKQFELAAQFKNTLAQAAEDLNSSNVSVLTEQELEKLTQAAAPKVDPDEDSVNRLLNTIAPVHEISEFTKVIIYGNQGTSKTTLSMHAPRPLLIAIEAGSKSLLNHEATRNADVMLFKSVKQVEDVARLTKAGKFGQQYDTYVLDTFSELRYVEIDTRVDEQYKILRGNRERYKPEGSDYQHNTEHMRRIAAAFRDVPKNVIFVCQEKIVEGVAQPELTAKILAKVGEYSDLMMRMTASVEGDQPVFIGQTRNTPAVMAKTRIDNLPTLIQNPTFDLIHRANMKRISDAKEGSKK